MNAKNSMNKCRGSICCTFPFYVCNLCKWRRSFCNYRSRYKLFRQRNGNTMVTPLLWMANKEFFHLTTVSGLCNISRRRMCFDISKHDNKTHASTNIAYHAGLRHTEFTDKLVVHNMTQPIPIFRILNYDGSLAYGWQCPFTNEQVVDIYKFMLRLSVWDDMIFNVQRQGRIPFYIQNQGEEAIQVGVGAALSIEDHLWCQYRELGVFMWRGFTLDDVLNQCFGNMGDEGKGRQMPISYTKRSINLQTICTPLTSQVPHAAGAGYAFKLSGEKKCSVTFFGEGAASEGDFHAAMNFAATLKSQTIFVCRNNGYAISTPVADQYAGDGIAIRGLAYGMQTVRVDGNDLFAVYLATKKCREICVNNSEPVCMEFMTYRMGHHSTSDDSSQYRPEGEIEAWIKISAHPIGRLRLYLERIGLWTAELDEEIKRDAKETMLSKLKDAERKKRYPILDGIFSDVYAEPHWHIKEQRDSLKQHLEKHHEHYEISKYYSI